MNQEEKTAQAKAIQTHLQRTTDAINEYLATLQNDTSSTDLASAGRLSSCQVSMTENVKQLQSAIYGPLNMVMLHYEEVNDLIRISYECKFRLYD